MSQNRFAPLDDNFIVTKPNTTTHKNTKHTHPRTHTRTTVHTHTRATVRTPSTPHKIKRISLNISTTVTPTTTIPQNTVTPTTTTTTTHKQYIQPQGNTLHIPGFQLQWIPHQAQVRRTQQNAANNLLKARRALIYNNNNNNHTFSLSLDDFPQNGPRDDIPYTSSWPQNINHQEYARRANLQQLRNAQRIAAAHAHAQHSLQVAKKQHIIILKLHTHKPITHHEHHEHHEHLNSPDTDGWITYTSKKQKQRIRRLQRQTLEIDEFDFYDDDDDFYDDDEQHDEEFNSHLVVGTTAHDLYMS